MKKKQVALLLAALMCITPMAESAAVMGAEFIFSQFRSERQYEVRNKPLCRLLQPRRQSRSHERFPGKARTQALYRQMRRRIWHTL